MTKIVVTGIGLVSPAGINLSASCRADYPLKASSNEKLFPHHPELPAVLSVPQEFSLKAIVRKRKDIKLMARANQFAVAALDEAIKHAKLRDDVLEDAGLFIAVGREPSDLNALLPSVVHSVEGNQFNLRKLFEEGIHWINPLSSLKTLPNMTLAHAAIHAGTMGPNMTLFGQDAFQHCVEAAADAIQNERCKIAIVGAADSKTAFYDRLAMARENDGTLAGEGAAIFILEQASHAEARGIKPVCFESDLRIKNAPHPFGNCGAASEAMTTALTIAQKSRSASDVITKRRHSLTTKTTESHRSAVITGIGLVSPLGHSFQEFSHRIVKGHSGIGPIKSFSAEGFSVANACEVRDQDWWTRIPATLRNRLSRYDERGTNFAVSAALSAVEDAQLSEPPGLIIYGTGLSSVSLGELEQDCLPYLVSDTPHMAFGEVLVAPKDEPVMSPYRHQMDLPLRILRDHWGAGTEQRVHFSACAAGAAAIGHGLDMIRSGRHERVLVGAADAMVHPFGLIPFAKLGATSIVQNPDAAAKPFDKERTGFVMGETAAFFVLESAESASRRKAMVYGHLLGWGTSCDAFNVTAPHPEGVGASVAMRRALQNAHLVPEQIDYINAHGTGTVLNDVAEARAIETVFGKNTPWVSSSKGQIGHCIGAAGAIEFAVALAALTHQILPPNRGLADPDPNILVRLAPNVASAASLDYIMSNSFGFGGQNVALILGGKGIEHR